jgi:Flp pilus assembly protein TadG
MFKVDNRGNVAVIAALILPLVISGAGFGVEVGYWRFDQVRLQQAADAAAYASAVVKRSGGSDLVSAATNVANSNGFLSASDSLIVNSPSTATPKDPNSVETVLTRSESPMFMAIFTNQHTSVRASATASFSTADNACILALNPSASKAADFAGNSSLTLVGCTVMSNSIASNSVNVQGSASVTVPCMYAVGGASMGGTTTLTTCSAVKTNQPPVADPYAAMTMPNSSGNSQNQGNGTTLNAGHYASLTLKKNVTLNSGLYVIDGGNLTINAGANVGGSGVTFYLINGASVSMNGNSSVHLSAPTTGIEAGFLFISDRSSTGSISINGDNASTMTGVVYSPNGSVSYNGNFSGTGGCTQIVAQTISWSGNATFNDNCSAYGMDQVKVGGVVRLSA